MRAVLLVVLGVLSRAAVASADAEAKRLFDEGRKLLDQGKVDEACRRFAQSHARERAGGTMLNLGECAERDGELARAWSLYDEAAREYERSNKGTAEKFARGRAAALEPKLAAVTVTVAEPTTAGLVVRIDGEQLAPAARSSRFFDPGSLTVSAQAPGRARWQTTVEAAAGARVTVDVPALQLRERAPAQPPVEPARGGGGGSGGGRLVLWTSLGVGLAGGAVWLYGYDEINDAERKLCPTGPFGCGDLPADERQRYIDQGSRGRLLSYVGGGIVAASVVAAGVGVYLVLGRGGRRAQPGARTALAVAPAVAPSAVGVALIAGF
jgi:hypothetical protein